MPTQNTALNSKKHISFYNLHGTQRDVKNVITDLVHIKRNSINSLPFDSMSLFIAIFSSIFSSHLNIILPEKLFLYFSHTTF